MSKSQRELLDEALALFGGNKHPPQGRAVPKPTIMHMLLDGSASMLSAKRATLHGCNLFIKNTAMLTRGVPVDFTAQVFCDYLQPPIINGRPLGELNLVSETAYQIFGGTALYDALAMTIERLESMRGDRNVVIVVQTDGEDVDSRLITPGQLGQIVAAKRQQGWQFVFLGLNVDSYAEAKSIGFDQRAVLSYQLDKDSAAFQEAAKMVSEQINGNTTNATFSDEQRRLVGDVFYKQAKLPPAAEDMKPVGKGNDDLKRLLE